MTENYDYIQNKPPFDLEVRGKISEQTEVFVLSASELPLVYPKLLKSTPSETKIRSRHFMNGDDLVSSPSYQPVWSTIESPAVLYEDNADFCTLVAATNPEVCVIDHEPIIGSPGTIDKFGEEAKRLMTSEFDLVVSGTNEDIVGNPFFADRNELADFIAQKTGHRGDNLLAVFEKEKTILEVVNFLDLNYIHGLIVIPSQLSNDAKVKILLLAQKESDLKQDGSYQQMIIDTLVPYKN